MANENMPDELFQLTRVIEHLHPGHTSDAADLAFAINALIVRRVSDSLSPTAESDGKQS